MWTLRVSEVSRASLEFLILGPPSMGPAEGFSKLNPSSRVDEP